MCNHHRHRLSRHDVNNSITFGVEEKEESEGERIVACSSKSSMQSFGSNASCVGVFLCTNSQVEDGNCDGKSGLQIGFGTSTFLGAAMMMMMMVKRSDSATTTATDDDEGEQ